MRKLNIFLDNLGRYDFDKLKKKAENFDVISFDVFDTLIKRDVPRPKDVFKIIEKNYKVTNFYENRVEAERTARRKLNLKKDVTLNDIYKFFSDNAVDIEYLKKLEIKTELKVCKKNLAIFDFYNYCKKNKKVIIISDMYLPRKIINEILIENGFTGFKMLFVSNEVDRIKSDGSLFEYAMKKIKAKKILHIGNSFKADYKPSLNSKNIRSFKVPTNFFRTSSKNRYFLYQERVKQEEADFLTAFINNHIKLDDYYYSVGFKALGPILCGFTRWLHDEFQKENFYNILFETRDSQIIEDCYKILYPNDKNISKFSKFTVSRRSILVPAYYLLKMNYEEIINSLPVPRTTTMIAIFDGLGLNVDNYEQQLKKYGFKKAEKINKLRDQFSKNKNFQKLFAEIYQDIIENSKKEFKGLFEYLSKYDFSKKTILIDLGWKGTTQKYLYEILNKLDIESNLEGRYLGLAKASKENLNGQNAKSYLFDNFNSRNERELELPFIGLLETFFLERTGSVKNYSVVDGKVIVNKYKYEYEESSNDIGQIQQGALDFAQQIQSSELFNYLDFSKEVVFENMFNLGCNPTLNDITKFEKFKFLSSGENVSLINKNSGILNRNKIYDDFGISQWKIGFLKSLFRLNLNYIKLYEHFNNKQGISSW
ncbi:HAD-IA family hydrolase [Liquorilactobacillus sicerae]|uniref:HAD-IA family hydrolase n=1 Tax=Liquorilactobacillus sicerae TaxID=1416943 RepID=UPI002481963A|nr:HAD-IA family hydrolase [Liquorilactobacillus sicerae]